jgi:hypothetical protein
LKPSGSRHDRTPPSLPAAPISRRQNITGSLLGNITDPSGAPIARASVEITNIDTNQSVKSDTDTAGLYQSLYLRPGPYRIRVNAPGFKQSLRDRVTIQVESTIRADFQLQLGEASSTVTVTGEAPLVDSESASLGQAVSTRAVEELPIQGRNIFDLAGLTAGVQVNPRASGGTASTGDTSTPLFVQSDISINGGRFRTNEYLVDGVSIMLPENNNYAFSPNPDGTQEFKVLTNSFGPQYGRSGGGVINVVTKGGSNDFHGTLYEFFRNDRLRANNFFSNARNQARPVSHFNQFGAVVGGRIARDKTFFFADYQGHRENAAGAAGILTVPTAAERTGDFSRSRAANGNLVTIFDPLTTTNTGTAFTRAPFPNAIVPAATSSASTPCPTALAIPPPSSTTSSSPPPATSTPTSTPPVSITASTPATPSSAAIPTTPAIQAPPAPTTTSPITSLASP